MWDLNWEGKVYSSPYLPFSPPMREPFFLPKKNKNTNNFQLLRIKTLLHRLDPRPFTPTRIF
jgi:hypothetical protein